MTRAGTVSRPVVWKLHPPRYNLSSRTSGDRMTADLDSCKDGERQMLAVGTSALYIRLVTAEERKKLVVIM